MGWESGGDGLDEPDASESCDGVDDVAARDRHEERRSRRRSGRATPRKAGVPRMRGLCAWRSRTRRTRRRTLRSPRPPARARTGRRRRSRRRRGRPRGRAGGPSRTAARARVARGPWGGDVKPDDRRERADEQHQPSHAAQAAAEIGAESREADGDGDHAHDLAERLARAITRECTPAEGCPVLRGVEGAHQRSPVWSRWVSSGRAARRAPRCRPRAAEKSERLGETVGEGRRRRSEGPAGERVTPCPESVPVMRASTGSRGGARLRPRGRELRAAMRARARAVGDGRRRWASFRRRFSG